MQKTKIAIVTNYRNLSYGSALQAYAMQSVIKGLGYDCENLQYNPRGVAVNRDSKLARIFKNPFIVLDKLQRLKTNQDERLKEFSCFVERYIDSNPRVYNSKEELAETNQLYDAFVCGSDQIWAPNQFEQWYFLSFVNHNNRKVAYAPSIGLPQIPKELRQDFSSLINNIGHLSIREKEGADLVKDLTSIDVPVVLDPTLLVKSSDWRDFASEIRIKQPYVLCYFLGNNPKHREMADLFANKNGLKRVVLPFTKTDYNWGDSVLKKANPKEFINLIDNAQMVLTDSFHGMAFSINLNKPFYSCMRFQDDHPLCQNSRIRNILTVFGLENRLLVDGYDFEEEDCSIDYSRVNELLDSERTKSMSFLESSLRKAVAGDV